MRAALLTVAISTALACNGTTPPPAQRPSPTATPTAEAMLAALTHTHEVFLQPPDTQGRYLRAWAAEPDGEKGRFALAQLAWRGDASAAALAIAALKSAQAQTREHAARVLAHVASKPDPAALDALRAVGSDETATLLWARIVLGDETVLSVIPAALEAGKLQAVTRLDGGPAFSAEVLGELLSEADARSLSSHAHAEVRAAGARMLGVRSSPANVQASKKLLADGELDVRLAAVGALSRLNDPATHVAVHDALRGADADTRAAMIAEIAQSGGGPALVLALGAILPLPEDRAWFRTKQIFDALHSLADPRAAEPLSRWAPRASHPHWSGEAGIAIAELGDMRASKLLGERLLLESAQIYEKKKYWQAYPGGHLSRRDVSRIVATRLLTDLAELHPEETPQLAKHCLKPTLGWLKSRPQPHANGMRVIAKIGSDAERALLRDWAFPKDPLPAEGAMPPFPRAYEDAQSALRYVGAMRDPAAFDGLLAQLDRKTDPHQDITQEGLMGAGLAMRGMALRAVAYGAANGLAEWGRPIDARALSQLMRLIEDQTWHEEARLAACQALPWIATDAQLAAVVPKIAELGKSPDPKTRFIAACYASGLARRAPSTLVGELVALLRAGYDEDLRGAVARAIGTTELKTATPADRSALQEAFEKRETRTHAALAWLIGGTADDARRTVASFAEPGWGSIDELKDAWYLAFGYVSHADLDRGNLDRWVANAEAIAQVELKGVRQTWAIERLRAQLDNLVWDNGPHSLTRVVLHHRLVDRARAKESLPAIRVLAAMRARGALMTLGTEPGEVGRAARRALHEVLSPMPSASK